MTGNEIRKRFLAYMEEQGHTILPSASLVPENDPSVLFNTAGMQPLVPYLMGEPHPSGSKRVANSQKCLRTNDIEEVGDNTHLTFFEMLGNWSLGDYFKKEAITWSYELLTSKEKGFALDPKRLYVTVFEGDENAPQDNEAYGIWETIFTEAGLDPKKRIFFMDAESNWWSPGDNGPCGPDSEMFYDVSGTLTEGLSKEEFLAADDRQDVVEIWNDVFMEYEKKEGKIVGKLAKQNVDTGSGLERIACVVSGKRSVYETDLFSALIDAAKVFAKDERGERIIADHMRAACFLIADGVVPSNTDQGYILRRLLRRAMLHTKSHSIEASDIENIVTAVVDTYGAAYPELRKHSEQIKEEITKELVERFASTLERGLKQFQKYANTGGISGDDAFTLYATYGFPLEITEELAGGQEVAIDTKGFTEAMKQHQDESRVGAEQKFKGGLADHSEIVVRYHTATHLLHHALREVLGPHVEQRGSNITEKRLRFDFSHPEKMTEEEIKAVEEMVNRHIEEALPVTHEDISKEEARARGAIGLFGEKYGEQVRIYLIGEGDNPLSIEFCGGPHVENTGELGHFTITKEESTAAGIRRIKATLS